jgi:MarR family
MSHAARTDADRTDADLSGVLRLAVMRLARRLRNERVSTDLTLSQLASLATLERHGSLTPGELAAHEKVQPPSMTRIIATLQALGLTSRAADRRPPGAGRRHPGRHRTAGRRPAPARRLVDPATGRARLG